MDINTLLKQANKKPGRTNLYIWKNLDHLKSYYANSIDNETIDRIADRLRKNSHLFKKRDFGLGSTMENHLNERCFCNLVEIFLIDQNDDALQ
ncbi:MAG: hypothetical protein JXJ04_24395, partial [Spirochaetales bacterium]|nr:hypothetical protein [Spirochaetales bacterium]